MTGDTTIGKAAKQNLEEVEDRIDEIDNEIDYQQCCDPNYEMDDREKELFFEMENLLGQRTALRDIVENGLP